MPKLLEKPIGADDFNEYIRTSSDFTFELQTLRLLRARGLVCEHGGLYDDPVTNKSREFDIRAVARGSKYCVRLAVECKNIRNHFPLLVSCVPRHPDESYHEVALISEPDRDRAYVPALSSRAKVSRVRGSDSCYKPGSPVGKSLAQVGRLADREETLYVSDSEVFDKWTQSLASADDLVRWCYWEKVDESQKMMLTAVVPIVVVPDERLWVVEYDQNGRQTTEPQQTNHCSFFVDKSYSMDQTVGAHLNISHLELVTSSGLLAFVDDCLTRDAAMSTFFPIQAVIDGLHDGA